MLNQVTLIGRLGKDPEMRYSKNGNAVTNFSMATDHSFTRNDERVTETEWHQIVVWGRSAEACAQYLGKGSLVAVVGRIATRSWEKDGQKHYRTEIVADRVQFLQTNKRDEEEAFDDSDLPF